MSLFAMPNRRTNLTSLVTAVDCFSWLLSGGARWWRFSYRFGGKQKTLTCGVYPEVGLVEARRLRDDARSLLRQNVGPGAVRRLKRKERLMTPSKGVTFEALANDWLIITLGLLARAGPRWLKRDMDTLI